MNGLILLFALQSQRGAEEERTAAMIDFQNCQEAETSKAARLHSWVSFPRCCLYDQHLQTPSSDPSSFHMKRCWFNSCCVRTRTYSFYILQQFLKLHLEPRRSAARHNPSRMSEPRSPISHAGTWPKEREVWPRSSVWTPLHRLPLSVEEQLNCTEIHVTGPLAASWPGSRESRMSTVNLLLAAQRNRARQR